MKKTILQCLSVVCSAVIGWLPLTAGTVSPYTENFDGLDTSKHDFAPLGWVHIVDSYSDWSDEYFVDYKNEQSGGQDGGAFLSADTQSLGSYEGFEDVNDLLVTPPVSGDVSMYLKLGSLSGNVKMFSCTESDGNLVVGEELAVDGLDQLSTDSWNQITLPRRAAGTRIAIRLEKACIDLFTAESAEIVLKPSLQIDKVTLVSESEPAADADGKFKVAFDVMITNNGQVDLNPGDENYSLSIIDMDKTQVFVTQNINVALAVGESTEAPLRIETEVDINQNSNRDRYDIQENLGETSVYGAWIEPIPYVGILEVRDGDKQTIEAGTVFDFGIVKDMPSTLSFNLRNIGGKSVSITEIDAPEGYSFSLPVPIVIEAGESKMVDVTLGSENPGAKAGKIVFVNDGTTTPEISVVGTVLASDTFYEDFEDELASDFICASNWERTKYPEELATSVSKHWLANSNATDKTMLITPKLSVADGESFSFRAAKRSAYGCFLNVYYSADRINWTEVKRITPDGVDSDRFSNEQPSYSSYNYCFSTFTVDNIPAGEWYIAFESGYALLDDIVGFKQVSVDHDLYLVKETFPAKGMVNNAYKAELTVKNILPISEAAGSYVAKLFVNGEAVAETVSSEEDWASGEEKTFALSYTPHKDGDISTYMQVEIGEYVLKSSEVTVSVAPETASMEIQVGEATGTNSNVPLALNWKQSQSQTIYTADKLGIAAGSEIVSLGYDGYCTADEDVTFHIKVWMMNTSATTVSVDAPVDPATMTLVYEGDHKIEPKGSSSEMVRLLDLPFSLPFVYDGTNLCVMVESTSDDYKSVNFANESAVANVSMYRRHDVELPATWTTAGMPVANFGTSREVPTISGKVTDGSTGEAVAATIELVSGDVLYKTETDAEGNYSMEVFQADKEYTMTVTAEGYDPVTETVTFTEGSVVKDIVFSSGARTVSGVVTDAVTNEPIEGVQVMMQSGWTMFMGMTDNQGKYSFEVSEPDLVYTLTANAAGYRTYAEENVSVAEGNIVRNIALDKLTISGVVTDAKTNEPLAGVRVVLSDERWTEWEVTTDENGTYSFEIADDSMEYALSASLEGYNDFEKNGITFAEGSIVLDIALDKVSGVDAIVVDGLLVKGVNNAIEVVAPDKAIVSVYDLGGCLIRSVEVNVGKTLIEGLVEGIYIVNHVKVVVK